MSINKNDPLELLEWARRCVTYLSECHKDICDFLDGCESTDQPDERTNEVWDESLKVKFSSILKTTITDDAILGMISNALAALAQKHYRSLERESGEQQAAWQPLQFAPLNTPLWLTADGEDVHTGYVEASGDFFQCFYNGGREICGIKFWMWPILTTQIEDHK